MQNNPEFTHHYHKDLSLEQKAAEERIVQSTYKAITEQIDINKAPAQVKRITYNGTPKNLLAWVRVQKGW